MVVSSNCLATSIKCINDNLLFPERRSKFTVTFRLYIFRSASKCNTQQLFYHTHKQKLQELILFTNLNYTV